MKCLLVSCAKMFSGSAEQAESLCELIFEKLHLVANY